MYYLLLKHHNTIYITVYINVNTINLIMLILIYCYNIINAVKPLTVINHIQKYILFT